jgi:putative ABC transport system permease protein
MGSWLRRIWIGLRWSRYDDDLREELDAHRALRQAQLERDGMRPDEAARVSRQALGNVLLSREDARQIWLGRAFDELRQDIRFGARALAAHRGVTAIAVLSLALGIGANAAAFSVLKTILFTPLPYPEADRLVAISAVSEEPSGRRGPPTVPEYFAWKRHTELFDGVAALILSTADLGGDGPDAPARQVTVQASTASLFRVLRFRPVIGRGFTDAEDPLDLPSDVILISDRLWQQRFGGRADVLGRSVRLDEKPQRIIGVMPAGAAPLGENVDVWKPMNWHHSLLQGSARGYPVAARLRPGVTLARARAVMAGVVTDTIGETGGKESWRAVVTPLRRAMVGGYRSPLLVLQGITAIVLLIACANVAGLLLARAAARQTELAVRLAIGAGARRLVRQSLTESAMLAALGGLAAIAVGWIVLRVLIAANQGILPRSTHMVLDGGVFAFTAAVSAVAAIVFGTLPALQASRADAVASLKPSAVLARAGAARLRARGGLVVVQIALAVVLLIASGLLIRTLLRIAANDLRGDPHGVLAFDVRFPGQYHRATASYNGYSLLDVSPVPGRVFGEVRQRLERLPGVESAAAIDVRPFTGPGPIMTFALTPEGHPDPSASGLHTSVFITTPRFFSTMRIGLRRGRDFAESDTAGAPWVAIINETMAKAFWPGADPLGRHIRLELVPDEQPREIVGIVADVRSSSVETVARPAVYTPLAQQPAHNRAPFGAARLRMTFVVRTAGDPDAIAPAVQRLLIGIDPDRPAIEVRPLEDDVSRRASTPRYVLTVINVFAALATLLAAVGLYGVLAQTLGQRRKELAIRMALGARHWDVWRLALGQVIRLLAIGLTAGLAGALLLTRVMVSLLWQTSATDGLTYAAAAALMAVVALVAAAAPIARAAHTAPAAVLKVE